MPDPYVNNDDLPTLQGEIARVQADLEKARPAGTSAEALEPLERHLAVLQQATSVFLRAKTDDGGVILGFNLPSADEKPGS